MQKGIGQNNLQGDNDYMQRECTLKQGFKTITRRLPEGFAYVGSELQLKGEGSGVWTVVKVGTKVVVEKPGDDQ